MIKIFLATYNPEHWKLLRCCIYLIRAMNLMISETASWTAMWVHVINGATWELSLQERHFISEQQHNFDCDAEIEASTNPQPRKAMRLARATQFFATDCKIRSELCISLQLIIILQCRRSLQIYWISVSALSPTALIHQVTSWFSASAKCSLASCPSLNKDKCIHFYFSSWFILQIYIFKIQKA